MIIRAHGLLNVAIQAGDIKKCHFILRVLQIHSTPPLHVVNLSLGVFPGYLSWFVQNGHSAARHSVPKLPRANVFHAWFQPYRKKMPRFRIPLLPITTFEKNLLFVNTQP